LGFAKPNVFVVGWMLGFASLIPTYAGFRNLTSFLLAYTEMPPDVHVKETLNNPQPFGLSLSKPL
jgi:hypothetical protein